MPWIEGLKASRRKHATVAAKERTSGRGQPIVARREDYERIYKERADIAGDPPNLDRIRTFIITTSNVASDDGVLLPDGGDFSIFDRRPIVLGFHDDWEIGIGRALDRRRILTPEDGWEQDIEFAPPEASEWGDEIFRFISWSGFAACSIRFAVTKGNFRPEAADIIKYGLPRFGWIGEQWQLKEISICNIPADEACLMQAARSGELAEQTARWALGQRATDPMTIVADALSQMQAEQRGGFAAIAEALVAQGKQIAELREQMKAPPVPEATTEAAHEDAAAEGSDPDEALYAGLLGHMAGLEGKLGVKHAG